jgi:tetratricopeptide (TPR) repeat protein|tara:strand:+ start:8729 stop:9892 length:1164 start_codon:yes stop_codon:yes gene_type:complete
MNFPHPFRFAAVLAISVALAGSLAAQSAGIAFTRKASAFALTLFPSNALAREELASHALFASDGIVTSELGMQTAKTWAIQAYRKEPLTPEAHAVLAVTEPNEGIRSEIVSLALEMNRRNSKLQAVILQEQVAAQDYLGAVATLDRILRVRPSKYQELFPILLDVFIRKGAADEFAEILDGTSLWHRAFFQYAVKQPSALLNLLEVRKQVSFENAGLDEALIKNLVAEGEFDAAFDLYEKLKGNSRSYTVSEKLVWSSTYSPFEWTYIDQAGFRAQPSLNSDQLEISIRPGKGGVVARRLIEAPETPFKLIVEHGMTSRQILEDIDISLRCVGGSLPFFDRSLAEQDDGIQIDSLPSSCSFVEIAIGARAWSGRSSLRAEIGSLRIR